MTPSVVAVFLLGAAGCYLLLERRLFEAILGLSLLAHAANLTVLSGSARPDASPALHGSRAVVETMADPLPQAMVLTAIVISMAITLYLLALLVANERPSDPGRGRRP